MIRLAIVLSASVAVAVATSVASSPAQTNGSTPATPPPASPQPPAAAASTPTQPLPKPAVPPDDQVDVKSVRRACDEYAKSQGLKDEAMRKSVGDCIAKLRPDLAGKM